MDQPTTSNWIVTFDRVVFQPTRLDMMSVRHSLQHDHLGRFCFSTISVEATARAVRKELLYMAPSAWRSDGFSDKNFFCFAVAVRFSLGVWALNSRHRNGCREYATLDLNGHGLSHDPSSSAIGSLGSWGARSVLTASTVARQAFGLRDIGKRKRILGRQGLLVKDWLGTLIRMNRESRGARG